MTINWNEVLRNVLIYAAMMLFVHWWWAHQDNRRVVSTVLVAAMLIMSIVAHGAFGVMVPEWWQRPIWAWGGYLPAYIGFLVPTTFGAQAMGALLGRPLRGPLLWLGAVAAQAVVKLSDDLLGSPLVALRGLDGGAGLWFSVVYAVVATAGAMAVLYVLRWRDTRLQPIGFTDAKEQSDGERRQQPGDFGGGPHPVRQVRRWAAGAGRGGPRRARDPRGDRPQ